MNLTIRTHNLISLLEELILLLERENVMLDRPNAWEMAPLVREKEAMFALYDEQTRLFGAEAKTGFETLTTDLREALKAAATRFDEAARANESKLTRMMQASDAIMQRIREAAKAATGTIGSYGADGVRVDRLVTTIAPVALNREC